ncbi:ATP-grasp domain-containing protein [bacterium]|nr:ATP-grasp domain-containing protein [bacterium]
MRPYVVLANQDENVRGGGASDAIAAAQSTKDALRVREAILPLGPCELVLTSDGNPERVAHELRARDPRVVFNLAEAARGVPELEACVAALLQLLGVAFTGNGPGALALSLDKPRTKAVLRGSGVPVPRGIVVSDARRASFEGLSFPLIVKPACMDASHGIEPTNVVSSEDTARSKAAELLAKFPGSAIVEEFVDGRELNVSVVEIEPGRGPTVLPLAEIDWRLPPGMPRVVGYEAKWVEGSETYRKTPVVCPADLSSELERRVREVALGAWDAVGCRDYARIDVRVDADERPFVIEVNPNPCISPDAGLARSVAASGLAYDDFIRRLVRNAEERGPDHPLARSR